MKLYGIRPLLLCVCLLGGLNDLRSQSVDGAALGQWHKGLSEDRLSDKEIAAVIAEALRLQGKQSVPWDPKWGDFVELARQKGKLSDELWRGYLLGAVNVEVTIPPEAKRSGGLPIRVQSGPARTGTHDAPAVVQGILEDDVSGIPLRQPGAGDRGWLSFSSNGGRGYGLVGNLVDERFDALKAGPQIYHYRYRILVFDTQEGKPWNRKEPLGERVVEGSLPWRLLAEDAAFSPPELRADEALRPAVQRALRANYVIRDDRDKSLVQVMIQVDRPPADMAFDAAVRSGDDLWPLGPVAWLKGEMGWWAFDVDLPESLAKVDLVLTPSAHAGAWLVKENPYRLMGLNTIWDGVAMTLSGVEIRRQRLEMCRVPDVPEAVREYFLRELADAGGTPDGALASYRKGCLAGVEGNLDEAVRLFEQADTLQPGAPMRRLIQRQRRRICALWLSRARKGDAGAMTALGAAYERGRGVGVDFQGAKLWYRDAANAGESVAMCRLAAMYERELGATIKTEAAHEWYRAQTLEWYRKSADLGNEEAQQWLASHRAAAAEGRAGYQDWVSRYAKKEMSGTVKVLEPARPRSVALKLVITMVEGEVAKAPPSEGIRLGSPEVVSGVEISAEGHLESFYRSSWGSKGSGGGDPMPADTLARMDKLLARLPEDGGWLPPPDRRVMIQAVANGQELLRVYDRADLPESIWELLRLSQCGISAYVPKFGTTGEIDAGRYDSDGFFSLSPDGKQLLFTGAAGTLQFWAPAAHELLFEIRELRGSSVAFSPDGAQAVIDTGGACEVFDTRTWKRRQKLESVGRPRFMPNGRHALLQKYHQPLRIHDAATWKAVASLPEIPGDVWKYLPAAKGLRAIIQTQDGIVALWDAARKGEIAHLRRNADLFEAIFSPDESLVAVATRSTVRLEGSRPSLGIFETETGKLLHELRPFEQGAEEDIECLLWSPDARYLMAGTVASAPYGERGINVFSAKSGRHRGQFEGIHSRIKGIALLPGAKQIVAGCGDGKIRFWDFQEALSKIRAFEDSLTVSKSSVR